jgi:hypothetical protein
MAGMNITGKGWYSAPLNSALPGRLRHFFINFANAVHTAESMTGMSTINSH